MTSSGGAPSIAIARQTGPRTVRLSTVQLVLLGLGLLAALVAVFWVFVEGQFRMALEAPADWGHTLIVPFISGYFVYLRKDELLEKPFTANWLGLPIVVLGVAFYVASTFGPSWFVLHHNARGLSIGITLLGLSLQLLGWRATRLMLFPLAYWVVFGQTVSDRLLQVVTQSMQDWSALGAFGLLKLFGVDVERGGNVITVFVNGEPNQLNVAEACSGMRMLVAFLALGVAIAYTGLAARRARPLGRARRDRRQCAARLHARHPLALGRELRLWRLPQLRGARVARARADALPRHHVVPAQPLCRHARGRQEGSSACRLSVPPSTATSPRSPCSSSAPSASACSSRS
jgi:exosortase